MHHDDRIGMRLLGGNSQFDIYLASDVGLAVDGGRLAADVEEAVAGEIERRIIVGGLRHAGRS